MRDEEVEAIIGLRWLAAEEQTRRDVFNSYKQMANEAEQKHSQARQELEAAEKLAKQAGMTTEQIEARKQLGRQDRG